MSRRLATPALLLPAALILVLGSLGACKKPDPEDASGYGRYTFDLQIERDATAGFVCIASVTDQMGRGTLRTPPFRVMPGQTASGFVGEVGGVARLEATITLDAQARRATYVGKLIQKDQHTVTFQATRDVPQT